MSFVPNFSVAQSLTASNIIFTDTSTGTDLTISDRQIYLQKVDASYLVPSGTTTNYIDFPISAGSSLNVNVLDTDYALTVTMNWLNSSGSVIYDKTYVFSFNQYSINFQYQLLQTLAGNPSIVNDLNFWGNLMRLYCDVFNADTAVTVGNDVYNAQLNLDDANYLRANQNNYFN